jgi:hypothetical protein
LAIFERDSFDIVHAQNSLDHSHNPFQAIQQMLAVVKPSGYVRLEHAANEGQRQNYQGLHQWNLDVRNGQLIVWNLKTAINISEELRDVVTSCWADEMCCSATLRKTE